jgi:DNA-binding Lrp family transcriptional regulator
MHAWNAVNLPSNGNTPGNGGSDSPSCMGVVYNDTRIVLQTQCLVAQSGTVNVHATRNTSHQRKPEGRVTMVSAIVLLNTERNKIKQVAEQLTELAGVSEVYSVAGRYDLVAILRVPNSEAMADLVTEHMLKVEGITDSETMIAFKTYSRHDLEAMFSIGFEAE